MTSTCKTHKTPQPLPSDARRRAVKNGRIVIAAALFALVLIGEAVLFIHSIRTIPDFLMNYYPAP